MTMTALWISIGFVVVLTFVIGYFFSRWLDIKQLEEMLLTHKRMIAEKDAKYEALSSKALDLEYQLKTSANEEDRAKGALELERSSKEQILEEVSKMRLTISNLEERLSTPPATPSQQPQQTLWNQVDPYAASSLRSTRSKRANARAVRPDNLKEVHGIGPVLERKLHEYGITRFEQIASWSEEDIETFTMKLHQYKGRIERDDWVRQSKGLVEKYYGNNFDDPRH